MSEYPIEPSVAISLSTRLPLPLPQALVRLSVCFSTPPSKSLTLPGPSGSAGVLHSVVVAAVVPLAERRTRPLPGQVGARGRERGLPAAGDVDRVQVVLERERRPRLVVADDADDRFFAGGAGETGNHVGPLDVRSSRRTGASLGPDLLEDGLREADPDQRFLRRFGAFGDRDRPVFVVVDRFGAAAVGQVDERDHATDSGRDHVDLAVVGGIGVGHGHRFAGTGVDGRARVHQRHLFGRRRVIGLPEARASACAG